MWNWPRKTGLSTYTPAGAGSPPPRRSGVGVVLSEDVLAWLSVRREFREREGSARTRLPSDPKRTIVTNIGIIGISIILRGGEIPLPFFIVPFTLVTN